MRKIKIVAFHIHICVCVCVFLLGSCQIFPRLFNTVWLPTTAFISPVLEMESRPSVGSFVRPFVGSTSSSGSDRARPRMRLRVRLSEPNRAEPGRQSVSQAGLCAKGPLPHLVHETSILVPRGQRQHLIIKATRRLGWFLLFM